MWAALRAQAQASLVGDLYAPLPPGTVAAAMQSRRLGAARLRLLPKATGRSCNVLSATFLNRMAPLPPGTAAAAMRVRRLALPSTRQVPLHI